MDLQGRSALVTGGAGGLGGATVRHLAGLGLGVVAFDRDLERATTLAKELGDGAVAAGGDVNDDDAVAAAIAAAQSLGTLSLVVNVAGGGVGGGRTVSRDGTPHDKASFVGTMEMNAFGTFNVTRLAASAMASNEPDEHGQRGVVVNTASIAGIEGQTGQLAYAAAKAAILGMTLPLARDLGAIGVRVCAIAPGTMGTPIMLSVPEEMQANLTRSIIFPKRMGRPEEFAFLVESIARNPYLNGENIRLDGALRFPPK
jgi:NAD(P)-dependent dehydrogenase (short-subunit alcohol dehydrogenase family)